MKRRHFVQQSSFVGSVLLLHPEMVIKSKPKHLGLQMWSVRDVADKDPVGVIRHLAEMGYRELEGYKYDQGLFYTYTPSEFKLILDQAGLAMPSAHTKITPDLWDNAQRTLTDNAKKIIADHAAIGVKQLICPHIDDKDRNAEYIKALCETMNHMGEACHHHGIQFGYHNHDFEFKKMEGTTTTMYDYILGNTDPKLVKMEMDLYWVRFANEDPIQWINKHPGRFSAFHVKDMANTPARESIEIGDGVIDFSPIFNLKAAKSVQYYIVELESYRTTSMDGVNTCLQRLKKIVHQA